MSVIIVLIMLLSVIQVVACHFSLWWIIAMIFRGAFFLRVIGAVFKVKTFAIGEGVAFVIMLLFYALFKKDAIPWILILVYALITLSVLGLELLDSFLYVYTVEDDDE